MSVLATTEILFFIFRYYLKNYFNNNVVNMIFSLIYVFCSIILGISLVYYLITFFLNIYIKEIILLPRFIYFTWLLSTITSGCISSYYGKRDNFLSKTQNFANEAISELSKTDFPDFRSTISMTALVIITLSLWCVVSRIINSMLISPFLFFIGVR
jgi:preprotein translocase subunit SecE